MPILKQNRLPYLSNVLSVAFPLTAPSPLVAFHRSRVAHRCAPKVATPLSWSTSSLFLPHRLSLPASASCSSLSNVLSVVLPSAGDLLQSVVALALEILSAEDGERSAGHELKGKPTANFPREEEGDILYRERRAVTT